MGPTASRRSAPAPRRMLGLELPAWRLGGALSALRRWRASAAESQLSRRSSVVAGLVGGLGEPRSRARDLCGLGTRRLRLARLGAPRDRVHDRRGSRPRQLDRAKRNGRWLAGMVERV